MAKSTIGVAEKKAGGDLSLHRGVVCGRALKRGLERR